jgi:hypothetical protein
MGLFLPILLLGLTVPGDQPPATPHSSNIAVDSQIVAGPQASSRQTTGPGDPIWQDEQRRDRTCFTVRSYIFERRNGYAPERVGMTTCDPARAVGQRHVNAPARLVPAN